MKNYNFRYVLACHLTKMGVVSILFSISKFLLSILGVYSAAKLCDHYIFPLLITPKSLEKMEAELDRHYKLDAKLLLEHGIETEKYVQLSLDDETRIFLRNCQSLNTRYFAFFGQSVVYTYLKPFVTLTSLHALLNRGSMFVLSENHLKKLVKIKNINTVVDLGAQCENFEKNRPET